MAGSTAVYIVRGDALFEYFLPVEMLNVSVDHLKLTLNSDAGFFNPPQVTILNANTGDWVKLDGINQGANLIPDAAKFVDANGTIKIKLTAENASSCFYLSLGLDGHR
jgi:hypothetical protein